MFLSREINFFFCDVFLSPVFSEIGNNTMRALGGEKHVLLEMRCLNLSYSSDSGNRVGLLVCVSEAILRY